MGEASHAIERLRGPAGQRPGEGLRGVRRHEPGLETTDDQVFITIRHANGGVSNVWYQAGGDRAGPVERIEVFGGGRTAVIDGVGRRLALEG